MWLSLHETCSTYQKCSYTETHSCLITNCTHLCNWHPDKKTELTGFQKLPLPLFSSHYSTHCCHHCKGCHYAGWNPRFFICFLKHFFSRFIQVWLTKIACTYIVRCYFFVSVLSWCFNIHIPCEVIATIKLINTSFASHSYLARVCGKNT